MRGGRRNGCGNKGRHGGRGGASAGVLVVKQKRVYNAQHFLHACARASNRHAAHVKCLGVKEGLDRRACRSLAHPFRELLQLIQHCDSGRNVDFTPR